MFLPLWLRDNGLTLPKDHWLIKKGVGPRLADVLCTTAVVSIVSLVPYFLFLLIIILPTMQEKGTLTVAAQIGFFLIAMSLLLVFMVCLLLSEKNRFLSDKIEALAKHLHVPLVTVVNVSRSQAVDLCYRRLEELAAEHRKVEQRTIPGDQESADSFARFRDAYLCFLHHSLIDDVGYGKFFKKSKG